MKKENKALARQKKAAAKKMQALKKKGLLIGAIVLAVALVVGVGAAIKISNDEAKAPVTKKFSKYLTDEGKIKGIKIEKYLALGDLDSAFVLKKEQVEPTEKEITELMEGFLLNFQEMTTEKGTVLEVGDVVQMQYVGTIDGKEFQGGTTGENGTSVKLGSGTLVAGFEDQLIGKAVGDEVDVEVTFPDNYANEELKGKDAVFAVVIDGVYKNEVTDEKVAEHVEGCSTVEEYYQKAYETIYDDYVDAVVWSNIYSVADLLKFPERYSQNLVDIITYFYEQEYVTISQQYYETYNQYPWETLADFYEQYYGMTEEDLMLEIEYEASSDISYVMVCQAIAEARNVTFTDEDVLSFISDLGYTEEKKDEAFAAYGEGYIAQGAMCKAVDRYVKSMVTVTE